MCYVGLHRTIAGVLLLLNLGCHRTQPEVVSLLSMTNAWLDAKGEQAFIKESAKRAASKMDAFRCQKLTEILRHPYSRGDIWAVIEFERFYHSNSYILYVLTETACFEYRFAKNWRVINRVRCADRLMVRTECDALRNYQQYDGAGGFCYDPLCIVFVTLYAHNKPAEMFFRAYPPGWDQRFYINFEKRQPKAYYTLLECLEHAPREQVLIEKTGEPYPGE